MSRARYASALAALVSIVLACSDATSPVPTPPPPSTPLAPPSQLPVPAFPASAEPAAIYDEEVPIYRIYGLASRFALRTDGTFGLQFVDGSGRFFEYKGRYTRVDSLVTFDWDGWSIAGPWVATGSVRGNQLTVRYDIIMMLSDFIDGTYVRAPNTP